MQSAQEHSETELAKFWFMHAAAKSHSNLHLVAHESDALVILGIFISFSHHCNTCYITSYRGICTDKHSAIWTLGGARHGQYFNFLLPLYVSSDNVHPGELEILLGA
jgi:hypothetical protein